MGLDRGRSHGVPIDFDQVIPEEKILASLQRFAEEAMPALREHPEESPLATVPAVEGCRRERGEMAS
jgi:hypothetical protein